MTSSRPVFAYWKLRARGQPIRTFLAFVKQDYEYKEYQVTDPEEWFVRDKPSLNHPLANLPYWKEDDLVLFQSNSIIRYLARKHGLAGKTPQDAATADMISEFFAEIRNANITLANGTEAGLYPEKKLAYIKNWRENQVPRIAKLLGDKDFLLGVEISYIDFLLAELLYVHDLLDTDYDLRKEYPALADFRQRFDRIPAIAEFHKKESAAGRSLTIHPPAPYSNFTGAPRTKPAV